MYASARRLPQVLLGLFVVGQLLFLFAANLSGLLARFAPDFADRPAAESVAGATTHWSQLTNQPQNWSLFAPEPDRECTFPAAMNVGWANGDIKELAFFDNEPQDLGRYFRIGGFRLRRYESALTVSLPLPPGRSREDMEDAWRANIFAVVQREWGPMRAYLRWRLAHHPLDPPLTDPPVGEPDQAELYVQIYDILPPESPKHWESRSMESIARWRIRHEDPDSLPIEAYNPIFKEFDRLPRRPRR